MEAHLLVADGDLGGFSFRHALTAEALRDQLLPIERAALSRRAAEAIEAHGAERLAAELWASAGEARRAAELFAVAAGRAAAQGAISTQISLLERAMSLAEPPAEVIEALIDGTPTRAASTTRTRSAPARTTTPRKCTCGWPGSRPPPGTGSRASASCPTPGGCSAPTTTSR
ncbi:hypothetical protein Asp14428_44880 [Actinoplanes sp. NBRC 14428]|nr:hypothetical protein Asp14428_44880 [Actinoplanes sp. NBRC 14428]